MSNIYDDFVFSTSWNVARHCRGKDMIEEIIALGFKQVELNYNVTREMLEDIILMLEKGIIAIESVHNVFPKVNEEAFGTDSMLLGYPDEEMRRKAIELTMQSVDYAAQLGAKAVVIHAGEVPMGKEYHRLLESLYYEGKRNTSEYNAVFNKMMEIRKRESPYIELIQRSLEIIGEYILKKQYNVVLGLENRTFCHQIPFPSEICYLLDKLSGLPIYAWYDIGHGIMLDRMGLFNNIQEINAIKDKVVGVHIHDAVDFKDHLCPYIYSDNYDIYIDLINYASIKVFELGQKCTVEDIAKSMIVFNKKLYGHP